MNPLTPGPPPPLPPHHQPYQSYYPPPVTAAPVHHGQHPVTQPCFNCGATTHWAQQCPEPRRNVPAGSVQSKPRNRGIKGGPGPIITRYPPPHPQHYHSSPYTTAGPPVQSPSAPPPYQQQYGAPYGAPPPPPPPPPPQPLPSQQPPAPHYAAPPPQAPYQAPPYQSQVNPPYQPPPSAYPPAPYPQQAPPPPAPPPHHHQNPYYPQHQGYPTTYRTPVPPPATTAYQFYGQSSPPAPTSTYPIPSHRPPHHGRHPRHNPAAPQAQSQQRHAVPDQTGPSPSAGPIIWRPAQRVERPLAATLEESEKADEQAPSEQENTSGSISEYWTADGKRTKAHPKISEFINDPALKSVRGGYMLIELDFQDPIDSHDLGKEDVPMELGSTNSEDGKPDVMDKLNGILSRQSPEPGSEFRAPMDGEFGRRSSIKRENRKESRDLTAHSPRRGRSKSPALQDSTYASYRSRTPSGGASVRRNRTQHPLPAKPDSSLDTSTKSPPKALEVSANPSTDYAPMKIKEEKARSRSRSASPARRDKEDDRRRHRDYNTQPVDESQDKWKGAKDNKKRRTSGANGIPAVFGRRW